MKIYEKPPFRCRKNKIERFLDSLDLVNDQINNSYLNSEVDEEVVKKKKKNTIKKRLYVILMSCYAYPDWLKNEMK